MAWFSRATSKHIDIGGLFISWMLLFVKVSCQSKSFQFGKSTHQDVILNGTFDHQYEDYININKNIYLVFNSSETLFENEKAIEFEVEGPSNDTSWPLLLTAERSHSVFSWHIPITIGKKKYPKFKHTLCPEKRSESSEPLTVFIFSTISFANITFKFVARIANISISNHSYLEVSPASSKYFLYQMPEGVDSVVVKVESPSNICATISIQNALCPVYDTIGIDEHSIYHLTMTKKGAVTIVRDSLSTGAFMVVLSVLPDNYNCHGMIDLDPGVSRVKSFTNLRVNESISTKDLYIAIVVGLLCFLAVYLLTFLILVAYHFKTKAVSTTLEVEAPETGILIERDSQAQTSYGSISNDASQVNSQDEEPATVEGGFENIESSENFIWSKKDIYIVDTIKVNKRPAKRQRTFFWNLVTVGIFYFLPVIQLVLTYQRVLHMSGDQDVCYYNFYCIHQVGVFVAFNSIFSNIGYIMLGLLFLYLVFRRENHYLNLLASGYPAINLGIPQRYDLFYAMGLALVVEGLLSACYHICPSYNNFQFDTSFMYMIGWLCMLKIYQSRHQDMSLRAHIAYSVIAFIVFFGVIGITDGNQTFWIVFVIIYLLFIMYLSFQVYYMGHWKFNSTIFKQTYFRIRSKSNFFTKPVYLDRLILLIVGNFVNWGLAIFGAIEMPSNFATYLLTIMIANFLMYFLFYLIMKIRYKERICFQSYLFITLAMIFWVFSFYFFTNQLTSWQLCPARSRESNKDCSWLNFYDVHDIWHFLSAGSLFFSLMVLLTLDDGLHDVPRDKIRVF